MASNLQRDIANKSALLKKGIKDLQSLLGRTYIAARQANNNKLIFIKRNVDKLSSVSKYINDLDVATPKVSRSSSFDKEIGDLHKETVANIAKMQAMFKKQESAEKKDSRYQGRFSSDQKNLDNLRLAHSNIRQMNLGSMMSKQDWEDIDRN